MAITDINSEDRLVKKPSPNIWRKCSDGRAYTLIFIFMTVAERSIVFLRNTLTEY